MPVFTFTTALELLLAHRGEDLLRVKGIVDIAEYPGTPAIIHGVQHVFSDPVWLDAWPDEDRRTRIVFITPHPAGGDAAQLLRGLVAGRRAKTRGRGRAVLNGTEGWTADRRHSARSRRIADASQGWRRCHLPALLVRPWGLYGSPKRLGLAPEAAELAQADRQADQIGHPQDRHGRPGRGETSTPRPVPRRPAPVPGAAPARAPSSG